MPTRRRAASNYHEMMATIPMLTVKGKRAPDMTKTEALTVEFAPVATTDGL